MPTAHGYLKMTAQVWVGALAFELCLFVDLEHPFLFVDLEHPFLFVDLEHPFLFVDLEHPSLFVDLEHPFFMADSFYVLKSHFLFDLRRKRYHRGKRSKPF